MASSAGPRSSLPDGLVADWKPRCLADLCSPRKELVEPSREGFNRYVGLEHLDPGFARVRRWATDAGLRSTKSRFRPGDVLYGKLRPYLDKAALAEWEGVCSTDILVLEPKPGESDAAFLSFLLHSPDFLAHAVATTSGVNHPRTGWSSIGAFEQPTPLPAEQRSIAGVLSKLQTAVELQDKIVAAFKELKAATMAKLFREGLRGEPLKQTEIGEMPESWNVTRFGTFATLQRGFDLPVQARTAGQIPVVGSNGVVGTHREAMVKGPGVATGRSGTIGLSFYSASDFWPLNTALFVTDFHGNDPLFVHYFFEQFDFQKYAAGVSVPTLNRNLVHEARVGIPELDEQRRIAEFLSCIEKALRVAEQGRSSRASLFSTLLNRLMLGHLRVTEAA